MQYAYNAHVLHKYWDSCEKNEVRINWTEVPLGSVEYTISLPFLRACFQECCPASYKANPPPPPFPPPLTKKKKKKKKRRKKEYNHFIRYPLLLLNRIM